MNLQIVSVCLFVCCTLELTSANIYGLMFNNPIALPSYRAHRLDTSSQSSESSESHKKSADMVLIRCKQDADCIDDNSPDTENLMYCDVHYGVCDFFRQVGELCRHDSQCDAGLVCMFGKCEQPPAPGSLGARCTDATDCGKGLCCANQHGERICKARLKLGQDCSVPEGGLLWSMEQTCPCEDGLVCEPVKSKSKR